MLLQSLVFYAEDSCMLLVSQHLIAIYIKYPSRGKVIIGARALRGQNMVECCVRNNVA